MKILATNKKDLTKQEIYKLTKSAGQNVKDVEGTFEVDIWALYEETNNAGQDQTVLTILAKGGAKLSTISKTFIDSFKEIVELMEEDPFAVVIVHGKSKSGRDYVSCELDC